MGTTTPIKATRTEIGFQPDIKQEDQYSHFRQDVKGRVSADDGDPLHAEEERQQIAQHDASQQFTQYRWLTQPFNHQAANFGRNHQDGETNQNGSESGMRV